MLRPALRLALAQTVLALVVCVVAWRLSGTAAAQGAGYGGAVALGSTMLMIWRHRQSGHVEAEPGLIMRALYRSSLERFVLVGALLAVGMGALGLHPGGVITGFIVTQLGWIALPFLEAGNKL